MDEEEIAIWRGVANPMATNFLKFAQEDIEEFHATADSAQRKLLAQEIMRGLLHAAEAMAGDEVSELAFGRDPPDDAAPSEHLAQLSERLSLVSSPSRFAGRADYPYSLAAIGREVRYLSWGDPPKALRPARRKANKAAKRREVEHWAHALAWVEFLRIDSDTASECKDAVAKAYGVTTDALAKWPKRIFEELGAQGMARIDRAGRGRAIEFRFRTQADGFRKLDADGKAYQDYLRGRDELKVVPIRGK